MSRYCTANEIDISVRKLYAKNGFVVLSEVRNGTGFEKRPRTADMLAISTWPSRGLFIEGIEIKRDRSDLRSELADPKKADDMARYCSRWHVAVPDDLITPDMMIPESWGIITVDVKGNAKNSKPGKLLEPEQMDALLVCSILRNFAASYVAVVDVEERIKVAVEDRVKSTHLSQDYRLKQLEEGYAAFKESSGVDLCERGHPAWNMKGIGEAVRLITNLHRLPSEELRYAAERVEVAREAIQAVSRFMEKSAEVAR